MISSIPAFLRNSFKRTTILLSRVANSIYWMSRYIERAENVARFIDVNLQLSLDQFATGRSDPWQPLVAVTGDAEDFEERYDGYSRRNVMRFLTLDRDNPNSIARCVAAARDNARTVRDIITSEMWQQINALHITVTRTGNEAIREDRPVGFYHAVKNGTLLFDATTQATMSHGPAFDFLKLGRALERADKTSRVLDVKYFLLLPDPADVGSAMDVVQWAALLRCVGALEMYRQTHGVITPDRVAGFLILDRDFPRAIAHCLLEAEHALAHVIGPDDNPFTQNAQRKLGRLRSQLQFGQITEIIERGLHETIDDLQRQNNDIHDAINHAFFEYTPPADLQPHPHAYTHPDTPPNQLQDQRQS
ncbi:MAG: alpha-E domain-containing protein [Planctomycetota bacterium]